MLKSGERPGPPVEPPTKPDIRELNYRLSTLVNSEGRITDSHRPGSAKDYNDVFRLGPRIAYLRPGSTIMDIGCGHDPQERLTYLATEYHGVNIVGIDFLVDETIELPSNAHVFKRFAEDFSNNEFKKQMQAKNLWPPRLFLFFNVLDQIHKANLNRGVKDVLQVLYDVMPIESSALIFESDWSYPFAQISQMANEIGLTKFNLSPIPTTDKIRLTRLYISRIPVQEGNYAAPEAHCVSLYKQSFINRHLPQVYPPSNS